MSKLSDLFPDAEAAGLPLSGGTLTGPLILSGDPTDDKGAVTKEYMESHVTQQAYVSAFATVNTSGNATTPLVEQRGFLFRTSTPSHTLTLEGARRLGDGWWCKIKAAVGSGGVTVLVDRGETIDGVSDVVGASITVPVGTTLGLVYNATTADWTTSVVDVDATGGGGRQLLRVDEVVNENELVINTHIDDTFPFYEIEYGGILFSGTGSEMVWQSSNNLGVSYKESGYMRINTYERTDSTTPALSRDSNGTRAFSTLTTQNVYDQKAFNGTMKIYGAMTPGGWLVQASTGYWRAAASFLSEESTVATNGNEIINTMKFMPDDPDITFSGTFRLYGIN